MADTHDPQRYGPSNLPPRTCDICREEAVKFYPVFSGGDIMTLCADCKADVAGGE